MILVQHSSCSFSFWVFAVCIGSRNFSQNHLLCKIRFMILMWRLEFIYVYCLISTWMWTVKKCLQVKALFKLLVKIVVLFIFCCLTFCSKFFIWAIKSISTVLFKLYICHKRRVCVCVYECACGVHAHVCVYIDIQDLSFYGGNWCIFFF